MIATFMGTSRRFRKPNYFKPKIIGRQAHYQLLSFTVVMPGFVPGIHDFLFGQIKTWMAGHRLAEATPSFVRLCPAMTGTVGP
jgi:hypothetical protein